MGSRPWPNSTLSWNVLYQRTGQKSPWASWFWPYRCLFTRVQVTALARPQFLLLKSGWFRQHFFFSFLGHIFPKQSRLVELKIFLRSARIASDSLWLTEIPLLQHWFSVRRTVGRALSSPYHLIATQLGRKWAVFGCVLGTECVMGQQSILKKGCFGDRGTCVESGGGRMMRGNLW